MTIARAEKIFGWLPVSELFWLRQQANLHTNICEIGSFMGRSTRALADNTRGTVTAVDTWEGSNEDEHKKLLEGKGPDWLYEEFCRNMEDLDNVFPVRAKSLEAAESLGNGPFDFIFIDAAHDYENVKADILAWKKQLAPGGLLSGHDMHTGAPGVVQAVNELLPNRKVFESIWYVVDPR